MRSSVSVSPASRLDTLPPFPTDGSVLTLAPEIVRWAESVLIQPNGPRAGKPFQFTPRQLRFLAWWYAVDEDGNWLFQHGVRRLPKGSGKSPFAAVLCLCEFCGPVRVRDIDHKRRIVVGKPVDMPWVQIVATAESQTTNTMRMVRAFAAKNSPITVAYQLDVGKVKYYKPPEGTLEVITSSYTAVEGAEASFVVADETEWWTPARNGHELSSTLLDNLAKSGARMLETSNAWRPDDESVAEATWDAWVLQEEGLVVPEAGRILYDAVIARPDLNWQDREAVREEMRRIYADAFWVDVDKGIMPRIYSPKADLAESKRKYGNLPTADDEAWILPEQWAAIRNPDREVKPGEAITLFFDGSKSRDATALIGCCMSDGHVFTLGVWEPIRHQRKHTGDPEKKWTVPVEDVDRVVREAAERYEVVGFFADVKEFESFVYIEWPELFDKLLVWAVPGGKTPHKLAWDMRVGTVVRDFTKAAELVHDEIIKRMFTHDDDPRLYRHVVAMRRRPNRWGMSVGKEQHDSPKKIDAGVAMIGARHVRNVVLASPEWQKRVRRMNNKAAFFS